MNYLFFYNIRKISFIIIDVFSSKAFFFAIFFGIISKILSIPYLTIVRGGNLEKRMNMSPSFTNFLFNNSAINISPSEFLLKVLLDKGHHVKSIPNFIDVQNYPFNLRKTITPKLLWVRSFHEVYNPTMAIEVLSSLVKEHCDALLTMVGPDKDGSQNDCIKLAEQLGVDNNLKITGKLSKEEWRDLSKHHDIFINTTHIDNTPVSVIEAMALGLPIVSTNVGGIPYLLKNNENALLVKSNDTFGMVSQIKFLINNPKKSMKISENAHLLVENFSWEKVETRWVEVIESIDKNNKSSRGTKR